MVELMGQMRPLVVRVREQQNAVRKLQAVLAKDHSRVMTLDAYTAQYAPREAGWSNWINACACLKASDDKMAETLSWEHFLTSSS
jgi:hypothetical protein